MRNLMVLLCVVFILTCCKDEKKNVSSKEGISTLFRLLPGDSTGIRFINQLQTREDFDVFRYRNFYNGGGVGIGDINNDGLADVFLTSNMGDNRLYLNKGNWKFEDISAKAGVKGIKVWSTGVSMADVNGDGWLDIYVCNSGDIKGNNRENELFINNKDLTFSDQAPRYGLNDDGYSTHAAFFDYDKDGDLDCYVLNNSFRPISTLGYKNLRNQRDKDGGHKLFRNDNSHFVDVSEEAGIFGSVIGFGLGVTVGDLNQDHWPDIYVSNDFYERDYIYINQKNGKFSEELEKYMGHLSMFSMGADLADLNNDGYPEIFSTDMLPKDDYRLKTLASFETYDVYQLRLKNGYYHQYMRNMLHLNNRDGSFSEIGELAGVSSTDWSWGALIADFDNDANKEIFISNGIYKDVTNQDFVEFLGSSDQIRAAIEGKKINFQEFVDRMPSVKLPNFMFRNNGDLKFTDVAKEWGLAEPSFSNGAAYGDLDNDGDLDLVVNNVNQESFVYRNQSQEKKGGNYLSISLQGAGMNTFALGACVQLFAGDQILTFDHMPIRGFQSSMDYKITAGLGSVDVVDSITVTWPDERITKLKKVNANQNLSLDQKDAVEAPLSRNTVRPVYKEVKASTIVHVENSFNDFDRDRLLYHMLSTQGPAFSIGDLNADGLDDFYMGGAIGTPGEIYVQSRDNKFIPLKSGVFDDGISAEDVASAFFDADGDDDLDLYVVSGGSENLNQSRASLDRFYINKSVKNGKPVFERSSTHIPVSYQSGSCVKPVDFDNDGDLDLFIGTRVIPSYYGLPCDQVLLQNDGKGSYTNVTSTYAPELRKLGMVTDAEWFDFDHDKFPDLIIVGDWMPITIFKNDGRKLSRVNSVPGLENSNGWWNCLTSADIDNDGDVDFVAGNLGLNSKFKPSVSSPVSLYVYDFDNNGSLEPVFAYLKDGVEYPYALRQDIIKQMSSMKKKFVFYKDYASKSLTDIIPPGDLKKADHLFFYEARTSVIVNQGNGTFNVQPLPMAAQVSPVFAIASTLINEDKYPDLILGGNLFSVKPEVGRYDALRGLVLYGNGKGDFKPVLNYESGLTVDGETRHISIMRSGKKKLLAFIQNNDTIKFYQPR
jgi:enediyne biosynthesis protein E4